jgi:hypothetical protein
MMGDSADVFRWMKKDKQRRHKRNRKKALGIAANDPRWTHHTEDHISTVLLGDRLDFWPPSNHWRWRGKSYDGDVFGFIRNREKEPDNAK